MQFASRPRSLNAFAGLSLVFALSVLCVGKSVAATNFSKWVVAGPNGRLLHQPDYQGNRIMDVSGVGYQGGLIPLPNSNAIPVRITISPVAGDNRSHVQNAINFVQSLPLTNGVRGAVLLLAGEYPLSGSITISASGVVLRGVGSGTSGGTVLRATATNQHTLVRITGSGSAQTVANTTQTITNLYVPVGARSFHVASTSGLSVGDRVMVRRVATTNWINDIGMDELCCEPDVSIWTPGSYNVDMDRIITRMEGNRIFIDAPVTCAIDARYANGTIRRYTWTGRISNSGIEHLRGVSDFNPNVTNDENHGWTFVQFNSIEHGWARNLVSQYFGYSCVSLQSGSKFVTVTDCQALDPVSQITGGRRYAFVMDDAALCLVRNCYIRQDRHQFVTQSMTTGPNVFVDGLSDNARSDAGPHHRWATGAFWDNITVNGHNLNIQNRGNSGSGHGWAGANCVVWNSDADGGYIVQSPPNAYNWLIGSIGTIEFNTSGPGPHDPGVYDSHGTNVFPNSIYYAQLQERLSAASLQTREYWIGQIDSFTNSAEPVVVEPVWSTAIQSIAAGQPLNGFDIITNNHWIPFTFQFGLAGNERIVSATLIMAMRSINTGAGNVLYLDSTTNNETFSNLGWLPLSTSSAATNISVRMLDLSTQTNLFSDGRLNVAVSGDAGIDWAMLELKVAPNVSAGTFALGPVADATVRAGASASVNFGNSTTLTVKEDSTADNDRKAYLRWDLSSITGIVYQARIRLTPVAVGTDGIEHGVTVATSNVWNELGINWNNQPNGGKRFGTWIPGANAPVEFSVTPEVLDALQGDKQLSVQLFALRNSGGNGTVEYASKEAIDPNTRPQLLLLLSAVPPVISDISNQSVPVNGSTGPIAFTVGSATVPAGSLITTGSSSDTNLVPNANIVFGGSDSNRTVTITPTPGFSGIATITITVTDTAGLSSSDSFNITVSSHPPGTFVWNGPGAGNHNWSTAGNWLPSGPPEALDDIKFFNSGASGVASGQVNNVLDGSFAGTVASLQYGQTNGTHTTLISPGRILTVNGDFIVGTETDNGPAQTVDVTIEGTGAGMVQTSGNFITRQASASSGPALRAILDLSGLDFYNGTIDRMFVGASGGSARPSGALYLARTNLIVAGGATPAIHIGGQGGGSANGGNDSLVYLGQTNVIFANGISIGTGKQGGCLMLFNPAFGGSAAFIRGSDGSSRVPTWSIGDSGGGGGTVHASGTNDFTGGFVDAKADVMYLGKTSTSGSGVGNPTGVLTFNDGDFDVNSLFVGYQSNGGPLTNFGTGRVNVNGTARLFVGSVLELGRIPVGGSPRTSGALTINGGTVFANTIAANAGPTNNLITINAGGLVVSNTAGPGIQRLSLTDASLGLFPVNGTASITVSNLITGGSGNYIFVFAIPTILSYPAQFALIRYSGAIGGVGNNFVLAGLPDAPICGAYLSNNIANNSIDLVVTNCAIPDPFLTWAGTIDGTWDSSTANWRNNLEDELTYFDGADVMFNDTVQGATNIILGDTVQPGSVVVSNALKTFTFVDDGSISGTASLTKVGPGTLVMANSGANDFSGGVFIHGGTVNVGNGGTSGSLSSGAIVNNANLAFNRSDELTVPNAISGSGNLSQNGSGLLVLNGPSTFTGAVTVSNGTLRVGNATALGAANGPTIITNAGALDVNGLNVTGEPILVSGGGAGGLGAIVNSGPTQISALRTVTLAGDVVFGGTNRWDIRNTGGTASLNTTPPNSAYRITKVGTNQVSLVAVTSIDPALGDIEVREGTFAIQTSTTQVGNPNSSIIVHGGATLNFFRLTNTPLNKLIVLSNAATVFSENDSNVLRGAVTVFGMATNTINSSGTAPSLTFANVVGGPGGITKLGTAPLVYTTNNTYSGDTAVNVGTLILRGNGSLSNSAVIRIAAGAGVDAAGRADGTFHVSEGQLLTGNGSVTGTLIAGGGSFMAPGTGGPGTLTISGPAMLRGVASMEINRTSGAKDLLQVGSMLSYGGILAVTNLAGTLAANDSFKLFDAPIYSGSFTNFIPATPGPGLVWDASLLTVNGTLRIAIAPAPKILTAKMIGPDVLITGTNGPSGGMFVVLNSTNVAAPILSWTPVATNNFNPGGGFDVTIPVAPAEPQSFYLIQLQ